VTGLNPLNHPVCLSAPLRVTPSSAWREHIPFAMLVVDLLRPKTIVELGTHAGDSYCAFCQAAKELRLDLRCYAVDTWHGDEQSGLYGPEVLADLRSHHDQLYGGFSTLIQSTFDDALAHFEDGTIDLLHIDGCHAYDTVKHDFESWLPKVSLCGMVLFHDTNEEQPGYGVKQLWGELKSMHPTFEFLHGHGLGILSVGELASNEMEGLFRANDDEVEAIRAFFSRLGREYSRVAETETRQLARIGELEANLESRDRKMRYQDEKIAELETHLQQIQSGIVMGLLNRYQRFVGKIAPWDSKRRYYYELGITGLRVLIHEGPKSVLWKYKRYRGRGKIVRTTIDQATLSLLSAPVKDTTDVVDRRVTVVVPTKNAGPDFDFTLERISNAKGIKAVDIVIVDSGSTDGTIPLAEKCAAEVIKIAAGEYNHGLTRNLGASRATGDYVLFMVQDAIPIGDRWLHEMVTVLESDVTIAAVTCRQVPRSDADLFACAGLWNHYRHLGFQGDTVCLPHPRFRDLPPREKRMLAGLEDVCCLIRKQVFDELKFRQLAYAEDLDLGLRLVEHGYKIAFLRSTGVVHSHNRPADYLLRRSYVESKSLPGMLSYAPPSFYLPHAGIEEVLANITMLYAALNRSVQSLKSYQTSAGNLTDGLKSLLQNNLRSSDLALKKYDRAGGQLDGIIEAIGVLVGGTDMRPNELLVRQYLSFVDEMEVYMKACNFTGRDINSFSDALYKGLAIVAGSTFASYVLTRPTANSGDALQKVDILLSQGV
jgi:GT2 family glycosyltransferase